MSENVHNYKNEKAINQQSISFHHFILIHFILITLSCLMSL